jgi:phytol kinase
MLVMVNALIAAIGIFIILVVSEIAWRKAHIQDELARKFVHVLSGTFIATLAFWVDYRWIMIMAVGFVLINIINRYTSSYDIFHFHAIHTVERKSWGDVLFGVSVFTIAWFEPTAWLFAASILMVSIADGLAAVAGVTYGMKHGRYYLFGQPKSIIGSGVFLISSFLILCVLFYFDPYFVEPINMIPVAIMLPLLLVCIENLAVYGVDNILLPLATLGILSLL